MREKTDTADIPVSAPDTKEGVGSGILRIRLNPELFVCTRGRIRIRTEQTVSIVPEGGLSAVPPGIFRKQSSAERKKYQ